MKRNVEVSISILNANFLYLEQEILRAKEVGIKYLHFDVMDGHFVPNISFGAPVLDSIKHNFGLINDVHLIDFVKAGADIITFHYEALESDEKRWEVINKIKSFNVKVGMSIKPKTDVKVLLPFLNDLDLILIMSVEPGFGGQKFMESALDKIKFLSLEKNKNGLKYLIEVDGGINSLTFKKCSDFGVDICVIGSYLYKSSNLKESYELLKV